MAEEDARTRFEAVAAEVVEPVRRFLARRTDPDTADDVLAEVLLVCWRRLDDVPAPHAGGALPWAYGVARNCLANVERGARRQRRLAARITAVDAPREATFESEPDHRVEMVLATMRPEEAELLRLWAWEQLTPGEIATVLEITPNAASIRLHRAREKFKEKFETLRKIDDRAGHEPADEGEWVVTDERTFDSDDELRALLAAGDPARVLAPADKAGLARLLEDTMSHDIETQIPETAATGTEGRNPLTWLVAAAAVFAIAGAGFFASAMIGDDAPAPRAAADPTVTELAAPPAVEAKCAVPTAAMLAEQELAFAGTVTAVEGDTVTIETTTAYAGEVGDVVEVTAPPADLQALLLATDFQVGEDYLVSATAGQVSVCGFSGTATAELQQLFQEAFPG